ncbi:hypothetical protein SEA_JINKIES_59 [Arthrobacter phage Jinkies]|uniref:Uncharacterized protein n=1 Tax=Arthrobacter phage Jinkies TaxID=2743903 RepID=A0A7T0IFH6_9CAUD|nr:hypothetical protein SEA_JINKIES_59 [Arthrobacter phage Jinkies]
MPKNWRVEHDPFERPLGCNGKYGTSGSKAHRYRGEPTCDKCRASETHYGREYRRGQGLGRPIYPCGTWQAAARHNRRGEPLDFPCRAARSRYRARLRAEREQGMQGTVAELHAEAERLAKRILSRRRRRCHAQRRHTPGHCQTCGVHSPAGRLQLPPLPERIAA